MKIDNRDLINALLILGIIFLVGGFILIPKTLYGLAPILIGGLMFGCGLGLTVNNR